MEFTLKSKTLISHLVLEDYNISQEISKTPKWLDGQIMEAKLTVNGVDIPAQMLEDLLHKMWKQSVDKANDAVDEAKFSQRVEQKALELIKNHDGNVLEKTSDLEQILSCPENIITPSWERV